MFDLVTTSVPALQDVSYQTTSDLVDPTARLYSATLAKPNGNLICGDCAMPMMCVDFVTEAAQ
jgi:hypothetical protein